MDGKRKQRRQAKARKGLDTRRVGVIRARVARLVRSLERKERGERRLAS
jgi:hypothetical protein